MNIHEFKTEMTETVMEEYAGNCCISNNNYLLKPNGQVVYENQDDYQIKLVIYDGSTEYYGKTKRTLVLVFETENWIEIEHYIIQLRDSSDLPCWWKTTKTTKHRIYDKYESSERCYFKSI